jgi:DNA ligase D-like protein (predicted ligase)
MSETRPAVPPPPVATAGRTLPEFVAPMLATPGEAFDSDDYLFEIKWDGTRALAFADGDGRYHLANRRRVDLTARYPDLAGLSRLPAGTVLDGEIVVLGADGKPDFSALQSRDHAGPTRVPILARGTPATFVAFDQLYSTYEPILAQPCVERRAILAETVAALGDSRVIMSQGTVGGGRAYFQRVCSENLEGVVAKRLSSPYLPGRRSDAWIKVKRQQTIHCVVIGFVPEGTDDFGALIIAAEEGGAVRCVGKVGTGFDHRRRARINRFLWSHLLDVPLVPPGKYRGRWVAPGLYLAVRCMERTATGQLRAPAVVEVYDA